MTLPYLSVIEEDFLNYEAGLENPEEPDNYVTNVLDAPREFRVIEKSGEVVYAVASNLAEARRYADPEQDDRIEEWICVGVEKVG